MSLSQAFSSSSPVPLTGFVGPANRLQFWNTDATNIIDGYVNGENSPSFTIPPSGTFVLERLNSNINQISLASPSSSSVTVCWGYQLKPG